MGRYANSKIRLEFPDLSEDDDPIWVEIRNPRTVPIEKLEPAGDAVGPDGELDRAKAAEGTYQIMAGLVTDWHVYDANLDDGPPLDLPATSASIKALPMEIMQEIMKRITEVLRPPQ